MNRPMLDETRPLALHYKIVDLIEAIKSRTPVSISDIELYINHILQFDECVTSLQKSRDNWKKKYWELKAQLDAQLNLKEVKNGSS